MPEGLGSRCMTACARDGSVTEVVPVPEEDWCVLAAAQGALCRHRLTAPLSWAEHGRFRHRAGLATQGEPHHPLGPRKHPRICQSLSPEIPCLWAVICKFNSARCIYEVDRRANRTWGPGGFCHIGHLFDALTQ